MITLIIPTMWKSERLLPFLYDISYLKIINQILIIDNNPSKRPLIQRDDISCISGVSQYLNPAWNLGIETAKNDLCCIMTDTTIFDPRLFGRVVEWIYKNGEDFGLIGLNISDKNNGSISIRDYQLGDCLNNFFRCFFLKKEYYYKKIPEDLELYFGDNFLFDSCLWRSDKVFLHGKRILVIDNLFYDTIPGKTTGEMPNAYGMYLKDREVYRRIITENGHDPKVWCPNHFRE